MSVSEAYGDMTVDVTQVPDQGIELAKLELEKTRVEGDLDLRKRELLLKEKELKRNRFSSPGGVAGMTAALGLVLAVVSNYLQSQSNLALEHSKAESALIIKAIETGDSKAAARNLVFLLDAGLIGDPSGRIAALRVKPEESPFLPSQHAETGTRQFREATQSGTWTTFDQQMQLALGEYQKAYDAQPNVGLNAIHLGTTLSRLGRYDEAIVALRHGIELDPPRDQAKAWYHNELCVALRRLGRSNEAAESCRRAIQLDPRYGTFQQKLEADLAAAEKDRAARRGRAD